MIHRHSTKNIPKPVALGERQRMKFAVRWILDASYKKMGKKIEERLAREMVAVVQGDSEALKKKEEVHKFAMVNRYVDYLTRCPWHNSTVCIRSEEMHKFEHRHIIAAASTIVR
jgi:hypothetical protein